MSARCAAVVSLPAFFAPTACIARRTRVCLLGTSSACRSLRPLSAIVAAAGPASSFDQREGRVCLRPRRPILSLRSTASAAGTSTTSGGGGGVSGVSRCVQGVSATAELNAGASAPRDASADRLRHAAAATAALHLPAVALLIIRAVAPAAGRVVTGALAAPSLTPADRVLCLALAVIAPELLRVVFNNFGACAVFSRRSSERRRGWDSKEHGPREALAHSVKMHYGLTAVVAAAQLAGLYTATIFPAPGCLATVVCTGLFYFVRRVRFEPQRLGRAHRVEPAEYRDVIVACTTGAFLVLGTHLGVLPLVLSTATLFLSLFYWACKWTFVPR
jgi:hypothetical protein